MADGQIVYRLTALAGRPGTELSPTTTAMEIHGDRGLRLEFECNGTVALILDIDDIFKLLAIEEVLPSEQYDEMLSRSNEL